MNDILYFSVRARSTMDQEEYQSVIEAAVQDSEILQGLTVESDVSILVDGNVRFLQELLVEFHGVPTDYIETFRALLRTLGLDIVEDYYGVDIFSAEEEEKKKKYGGDIDGEGFAVAI